MIFDIEDKEFLSVLHSQRNFKGQYDEHLHAISDEFIRKHVKAF